MNGFIKRAIAVLCVGGAATLSGCCKDCKLCDCYDNCWLPRYSFEAAQSVNQAFGAQVGNGHILDQTVYTWHFEPGTEKLTKGGLDHLSYLAHRRPEPDCRVYVQSALDVTYDPAAPEKYASARSELDAKRVQAVQKFLNAETARMPVPFVVEVNNAPTPGLQAQPMGIALQRHYSTFVGSMQSVGTAGGAMGGTPAGGGSGARLVNASYAC